MRRREAPALPCEVSLVGVPRSRRGLGQRRSTLPGADHVDAAALEAGDPGTATNFDDYIDKSYGYTLLDRIGREALYETGEADD